MERKHLEEMHIENLEEFDQQLFYVIIKLFNSRAWYMFIKLNKNWTR